MMQATVLAFMLTVSVVQAVHLDFVYHNYTKMEEYLQNVNAQYPNLTQLYSIGQSVKGAHRPFEMNLIVSFKCL